MTKRILLPPFIFLVALSLTSCHSGSNEKLSGNRSLTILDTNTVLETTVNAFDDNFGITFENQPLRVLPNKFIQADKYLIIKRKPVRFVEADSSQMDPVFSRPLFYLTLFDFKFLTDSTAKVSIVFRDVGDGGRFLLLRNPSNQWIITRKSFFKL
ncbi:hypothetical protein [Larkinella knui]|uniref:DUF4348 domain-containing protein n=1 Tax=Larkinella knui TaxID=2025310 RepID=A0A3P1CWF5_9BACT|nr:hypothetical protein [Larkinella knui]RRB17184.1 hypothetical protein EHT87_02570 [Larkinella knui]